MKPINIMKSIGEIDKNLEAAMADFFFITNNEMGRDKYADQA